MAKLFDYEVPNDAVVLAVNIYPPEIGAEIKLAQSWAPEDALRMRREFIAGVCSHDTDAYQQRVISAGEANDLIVLDLSTGQMLLVGDADSIAAAREELAEHHFMSEYTAPEMEERLKLVANGIRAQELPILTVSVYNEEDGKMIDSLNANGGMTPQDDHAMYQRAVKRHGGEDAVTATVERIAKEHNLVVLNHPAREEFALKGVPANIAQAEAAFHEAGFSAAQHSPDDYVRHLSTLRNLDSVLHVEPKDVFDDDSGPQGGTSSLN